MSEEIVSLDCSKCGSEIGQFEIVDCREYLHVGGMLCREAHGVCIQCGQEFHWSVPDRKLGKQWLGKKNKFHPLS